MSHHETPASIEAAQDATQADHEGRLSDLAYEAAKGHPLKYPSISRGPLLPWRRAWCLGCGRAVSQWTNDLEVAQRAGASHVKSAAADVVAGVSGE